jgi:DNA-binding response OmpR family regulator
MSLDNKKVLIIDDNPTLATTLEMILELKGFSIETAGDGITGYNMIKEVMPDIVILDVMLPGMDGFQVCEKSKSDPDTKDIPIIMLTGKDTGADFDKALEKKADWYIVKPYNIEHLMSVFDKLLK